MAAAPDLDVHIQDGGPTRTRRRRTRVAAISIAIVPMLLLSACKLSDVTGAVTGLFGMGKNEVATPQFEITNGITIQVVLHAPEAAAGTPITVHVRCSGGTEVSDTITIKDSGDVSLGTVSFKEGWPVGLDCIVSQETVKGLTVASTAISIISKTLAQADFVNR